MQVIKSRTGFTLIELLVTISLVGVMMAAVVSLIGVGPRQAARDARRKADLEKIASALELYRSDNSGYPTGNCGGANFTCISTYLASPPKDPSSPARDYSYTGTGTCTATRCSRYALCADLEKNAASGCADYQINNP